MKSWAKSSQRNRQPVSSLTQKDAATRRKTPTLYRGVDLEKEALRYCQHFGFKRNVELRVKHSSKLGNTHGYQWTMVTTLTIGPYEKLPRVLQMLLHEICHVNLMDHSSAFIERMVFAARDIWGINIDGWQDVRQGHQECLAYAIDAFVEERLKQRIEAGEYTPLEIFSSPV